MSAMSHPRQMEQVLESLAVGKTDATSPKLELQPQWRLVSRDGSTSSVNRLPPDATKDECSECLAGRGSNDPQPCRCLDGDVKPTISMDRLTDWENPKTSTAPTGGIPINAEMPQAKPQLFERAPKQLQPASFLESLPLERKSFLVDGVTSNDRPAQSVSDSVTEDYPAASASVSQPQGDELQKVIDRWPRLPRRTRHTILELAGVLSEADSA